MQKKYLNYLFVIVAALILVGCGEGEPQVGSILPITPTLPPTPTLVPLPPERATATAIANLPPTPTLTPTITPTPSPTPPPDERLMRVDTALAEGNTDEARIELEAFVSAETETGEHLIELGQLYIAEGDFEQARATLIQALELDPAATDAHFHLGEVYVELGECPAAIGHYEQYLAVNDDMAAYIAPRIVTCHATLENAAEMVAAMELAATADSHFLVKYANRIALAERYKADGRYRDAEGVYLAIQNDARTERTRGEMLYYIGNARLLDGGGLNGYDMYRDAVNNYPQLYTSYLALIEMIDDGYPVNEFQRGVVDYYAGAYQLAIEAFERFLQDNPDSYEPYLYIAWSYEGLGDIDRALQELEKYANFSITTSPIGMYEQAKMLQRQGMYPEAIAAYDLLATTIPQDENAPEAAWRAAQLTDFVGDDVGAIELYQAFAAAYPDEENVPEALFRAGWLARQRDEAITALEIWETVATNWPATEYGQAALLQLLTIVPDAAALPDTLDAQAFGNWYYSQRVRDELEQSEPFTPVRTFKAGTNSVEQDSAESYLRDFLGLEEDVSLASVSAEWENDPHRIRGEKLWQLGLFEEAKREFGELRAIYSDDVAATYQLALYFRDIGLYRSSIIAASQLLYLLGTEPLKAPPFIAKLAYPTYYADLIVPLAEKYEYDPLLQFALIRQESLFESFATSTAIAQGLAQVIPDTGQYIADKLAWPDYENADLYKPYVGLEFGGFYLAEQLALFDGTTHSALAAYNAGPGNALNWYAIAGDDLDDYHEIVNFPETRLYIERIYTGHAIYRALYGK
jgi:soluble lytic murein transglycosylase